MLLFISSLLFYIFLLKKLKEKYPNNLLYSKYSTKEKYLICDEPLCL